jgi:hypothetical protein
LQPNFGGIVLVWPPSKLCPVIPIPNQDGHQAKNRKKEGCNLKGVVGHKFERDPLRDHPCQVWFNLVQRFQMRRFKCDLLSKYA